MSISDHHAIPCCWPVVRPQAVGLPCRRAPSSVGHKDHQTVARRDPPAARSPCGAVDSQRTICCNQTASFPAPVVFMRVPTVVAQALMGTGLISFVFIVKDFWVKAELRTLDFYTYLYHQWVFYLRNSQTVVFIRTTLDTLTRYFLPNHFFKKLWQFHYFEH